MPTCKWEYKSLKVATSGLLSRKVDKASLESSLNRLGADGWELVSAVPTISSGATDDVILLFKRPVT